MEKLITQKQKDFITSLWVERYNEQPVEATLSALSMREASDMISRLLALPKVAPAVKKPAVQLEEGIYFKGGVVYKVQISEAGRAYAKVLHSNGFVYDPTAIKDLSVEDKITLAQAKEYGIKYGVCCVCGRTLTDSVSVAEGIGPVCGKRI